MVRRMRITEQAIPGMRLGRHVNHDPRNRNYEYPMRKVNLADLISVRHQRFIPVLDQGNLGSCTGNAGEGACGTSPLYEAIVAMLKEPDLIPSQADADLDEEQAVRIYSLGTENDAYPGEYPPTDTGCDGPSVCMVMKQLGLISGYQHAFDVQTALTALENGPVLLGLNWYSSFDNPKSNGLITITHSAYVRGGHEVVLDEIDAPNKLVWFTNSWSADWGVSGRAHMSFSTLERLLSEDGDVTIPVAISQPAPVPTPPLPDPSGKPSWFDELVQKIEDLLNWLKGLYS